MPYPTTDQPRIAVTREGDPPYERKRFIPAKHIPQNERHTSTNNIAAPGGVTAMRGGLRP